MSVNQSALDVAELAGTLANGYYTYSAAIAVACDPRAVTLAPPVLPGQVVPIGIVPTKHGKPHQFHFSHWLEKARNPALANEFEWVWFAGSLIKVGDALSRNNYFDRAPELELVRHLRNGIAHGNQFNIENEQALSKFPAHNRLAWARDPSSPSFEISRNIHGQPVLFDFMGPGDVLDLLHAVHVYLQRLGNGQPLRP